MNLYDVKVVVIVRLQGANSPEAAEQQAWNRIAGLISKDPLASVEQAVATATTGSYCAGSKGYVSQR